MMRACLIGALLALAPGRADAWDFPEHAVLSDDGLERLPPLARLTFAEVIAEAREGGLRLCHNRASTDPARFEEADVYHHPITGDRARCVPYGALAAFAADHARSTACLQRLARLGRGGGTCTEAVLAARLLGIAVEEWREVLEEDPGDAGRTDLLRDLDTRFFILDSDYVDRAAETNAHFFAADRSIDAQLEDARRSEVDHSLSQFLYHHLRSLQLAASARGRDDAAAKRARTGALLRHAFALHFIQDAFAAGHLVMYDGCCDGSIAKKQRHDYYCQFGLAVTRALAAERCTGYQPSTESGAQSCFASIGDGYLGNDPEEDARRNAAEAVARVQIQLALALDPGWAEALAAGSERDLVLAGALLDPIPPWTVHRGRRALRRMTPERARAIVAGALEGIAALQALPEVAALDVGRAPARGIDARILAGTLAPCVDAGNLTDPGSPALCDDGVVALGSPGVSLVRPLVSSWPASQADVRSLTGRAAFDTGLAFQVLGLFGAGLVMDEQSWEPVGAQLDAGFAGGFALRLDNVLPGRDNRSAVELNVGALPGYTWDGQDDRLRTTGFVELRVPLLWEVVAILYRATGIGHSAWELFAGDVYFLGGGRVYVEVERDHVEYAGFDVEVVDVILPGADPLRSSSPTSRVPTELRLRFGNRLVPIDDTTREVAVRLSLELVWGLSSML